MGLRSRVIQWIALLSCATALAWASDGPLTNGANIPVRTDTNGYLLAAAQTYTGPDGPRRIMANTLVRTDANGYLIITNPAGFGGGGMEIGGDVTSGTTGSVLFVGAGPVLAQDNAKFFWDDANNRLGIGTATPLNTLAVEAAEVSIHAQATTGTNLAYAEFLNNGNSFLVGRENSAGGGLLSGGIAYAAVLNSVGAFPMQFGTTNAVRMTIDSTGLVGIGTAAPTVRLTVSDNVTTLPAPRSGTVLHLGGIDAATPRMFFDTFGVGQNAEIAFRKATGNNGSQSAVELDDVMGGFAWYGYGATAYGATPRAALLGFANATWTDASQPIYIDVSTTATGSTTRTRRLRFGAEGNINIGGGTITSNGTQVLEFEDGTAPTTAGTNKTGIFGNDVGGTVNIFAINEANEITRLTYGTPQTYTESNVTTDRTFNANATSIDELADVLGSLIVDLRARGIVN